MGDFEKLAKSLKKFLKKEAAYGFAKTAEERELYMKGKIFGMGMAEGFLEKLAQEIEALQTPSPSEPIVAPQQVPAGPAETELDEIKKLLRSMTPSQIFKWILQQNASTLEIISKDPELSSIVDTALAQVENAGLDEAEELIDEYVGETEEDELG